MNMRDEYRHLEEREALKVENDVIKMKLMLEHGAEFRSTPGDHELTPEAEHEFLNYIMDFEQQEALAREVTVFEVLGSPAHFPAVADIPETELSEWVGDLLNYMKERAIELTVFSPNVGQREIYRFVTEELFDHRMLHMNMPGMITCFIYDEFHPDHPYENSRTAVNECIREIFQDAELQWTFQYEQRLTLNGMEGLGIDGFRNMVNRFKKRYHHIQPLRVEAVQCLIEANLSVVKGTYEISFSDGNGPDLRIGEWEVGFRYWDEMDIWMIYRIQVEGIDFE